MSASDYQRAKAAPGIRRDRFGFEAYVKVSGRQHSRRFPPSTSISSMQFWRASTRQSFAHERDLKAIDARRLKKSITGWCYVYFVRSGCHVKIGTSENPAARMRTLQTSHPEPLQLLAAVPAHAALEPEIHRRFAHLIERGEWFRLEPELSDFIKAVADGQNPVALLW